MIYAVSHSLRNCILQLIKCGYYSPGSITAWSRAEFRFEDCVEVPDITTLALMCNLCTPGADKGTHSGRNEKSDRRDTGVIAVEVAIVDEIFVSIDNLLEQARPKLQTLQITKKTTVH